MLAACLDSSSVGMTQERIIVTACCFEHTRAPSQAFRPGRDARFAAKPLLSGLGVGVRELF